MVYISRQFPIWNFNFTWSDDHWITNRTAEKIYTIFFEWYIVGYKIIAIAGWRVMREAINLDDSDVTYGSLSMVNIVVALSYNADAWNFVSVSIWRYKLSRCTLQTDR